MKKQEIIEFLLKKYDFFVSYINGLTDEDYLVSYQQKWTAGQQLAHLVQCVKPLVKVYGMDKPTLEQTFGFATKPSLTYEGLLEQYNEKLNQPYTLADRYAPEPVSLEQRQPLTENLTRLIQDLCTKVESFTEQELDTFCIPHPLLGSLTLREMLQNAIAHVEHHHEATKQNITLATSKN